MSLKDLKHGSLYVILSIRKDPPVKDDFHWGLYLHEDIPEGGTNYHIKQTNGWTTDHGRTRGVFKSFLLVGLFRIADVPASLLGHADRTIRTYDNQTNTPGKTCRVWGFLVLELLKKKTNGHTILKCDNLDALQREIFDWGNSNAAAAAANKQPRALGVSRICQI
jgi:hypothetical protein